MIRPLAAGDGASCKQASCPLDNNVSMGMLFAVCDLLETQLNAKWL